MKQRKPNKKRKFAEVCIAVEERIDEQDDEIMSIATNNSEST